MSFFKEIARHVVPYRFARLYRQTLRRIRPDPKEAEMLRTRTEEELDLQGRGLKEMRDVLDGLGIPYYVAGGALLGAIRDGDFIKWDFDVDIETKTEIVRPKLEPLIMRLKGAGFRVESANPSRTDFKVIAVKYGVSYELAGFLKMGKMRYRRRSFHPDYADGGEITLRGERYKTFAAPETYLDWFYGNWKTPIRAVNDYFPTNSRTNPVTLTMIEVLSLYRRLVGKE